jgi:hypothetical protein
MTASRGARYLLRNGWDYLKYQEYERALSFFREAEGRKQELNDAERRALAQGIDEARKALRETAEGSARPAYALSGQARRPGAFSMGQPAPAPAAEPIQLTGAETIAAPLPPLPAEATPPVSLPPLPGGAEGQTPAAGTAPASASASGSASTPAPGTEGLPAPPPLTALPASETAPLPALAATPAAPGLAPTPAPAPTSAPAPAPAVPTPTDLEPVPLPSLSSEPSAPAAPPAAGSEAPAIPPTPAEPVQPVPAPAPAPEAAPAPAPAPEAAPAASDPAPEPPPPAEAPPLPASDALAVPPASDPSLNPNPAPAPASEPAPVPVPDPAAQPEAPAPAPVPVPDAAEAPSSPLIDDARNQPQVPAGESSSIDGFLPERGQRPAPSTLSPELQREVERIAQKQEEELIRNRAQQPPDQPEFPGGMPAGPVSTPSTRLEISRAPSPTEARPIRAIPVPDEFVPLPRRDWAPQRKYWSAAATCHLPLYFQDAALERYGHSVEQFFGPNGRFLTYPVDDPKQSTQRFQILQPVFSAGLMAAQIALWPYNLVMDPPWEAEYDLGYYRPGDRIPTDIYYLPLSGVGPPLRGARY